MFRQILSFLILLSALFGGGFAVLLTEKSVEVEKGFVDKYTVVGDINNDVYVVFQKRQGVVGKNKGRYDGKILPPRSLETPNKAPKTRMRAVLSFEILTENGEKATFKLASELLKGKERIRLKYNEPEIFEKKTQVQVFIRIQPKVKDPVLWEYLGEKDGWRKIGGITVGEGNSRVFIARPQNTGIFTLFDHAPIPETQNQESYDSFSDPVTLEVIEKKINELKDIRERIIKKNKKDSNIIIIDDEIKLEEVSSEKNLENGNNDLDIESILDWQKEEIEKNEKDIPAINTKEESNTSPPTTLPSGSLTPADENSPLFDDEPILESSINPLVPSDNLQSSSVSEIFVEKVNPKTSETPIQVNENSLDSQNLQTSLFEKSNNKENKEPVKILSIKTVFLLLIFLAALFLVFWTIQIIFREKQKIIGYPLKPKSKN